MNTSYKGDSNACSGSLDTISSIILTTMNVAFGIMSVFGNALVLIAIVRTPRLRKMSNFFVASLATADFSVGLVMNSVWAAKSALNVWKNQHPLTQAAEFLTMQTMCATTLSLCAVSLDRFLAIAHVYLYEQYATPKRCFISIALIWIFSFMAPIPRLFITDPMELPNLWIAASVTNFGIPFSIITFCYFRIYRIARAHSKRIEAQSFSGETTKARRKQLQEKKAAFTIGIVIGVFIIFSSPSLVLASIQIFSSSECSKHELIRYWSWAVLIAFACSALNPWIYAIRCLEFRNTFYRLLGIRRTVRPIGVAGTFSTTEG